MSIFNVGFDDIRTRKGRKWTRYDRDVIPMWIADSDYHIAPQIKQAIIKAVNEEDMGYSDDSVVRELISKKIEERNDFTVTPENICITQGVLPAMWLACKYACSPGDEVIVTEPMYYPFFEVIRDLGAKPVYWRLYPEEGYCFDSNRLNEIVTPRTRLVFLCNPHNPTARAMTKEELSGLSDIVVDRGLTVMADELWEDVVYDDRRHISLASLNPEVSDQTMTAFGFSKMFSVAGLQVGYLASTNSDIIGEVKKIGSRALRGTSTLSLAAAKVMLSDEMRQYVKDALAHLQRMRDLTLRLLARIPYVECNTIESTYLAFPKIKKSVSEGKSLAEYLLDEAKVALEDGSRFGSSCRSHVRMNFGTGEVILTEAIRRIGDVLGKL